MPIRTPRWRAAGGATRAEPQARCDPVPRLHRAHGALAKQGDAAVQHRAYLGGEGGVETDMTKADPMTDVTLAPAAAPAADQIDAQAALAALDESLAYYTPETPVVLADAPAAEAYLPYYEAA